MEAEDLDRSLESCLEGLDTWKGRQCHAVTVSAPGAAPNRGQNPTVEPLWLEQLDEARQALSGLLG